MSRLPGAIASLGTGTYSVSRSSVGTLTNGVVVPDPSPTTLSIEAAIQPASGRQLQRLPEGKRNSESIGIWTTTALRTADVAAGVEADVVTYKGAQYQVENVRDWMDSGGFYECVALRVGR